MLDRINSCSREIHIALVGKYVKLHDAYLSVAEALHHAGYENSAKSIAYGWIPNCWTKAMSEPPLQVVMVLLYQAVAAAGESRE